MWFGWGWGMMFFVPLFCIFGAIAVYYFLISSRHSCNSHDTPKSYQSRGRASEILAERYAKGEISRDEFQQIRKELEK